MARNSRRTGPSAPAAWPHLSAADIGIINRENTKYNKRLATAPRYPAEGSPLWLAFCENRPKSGLTTSADITQAVRALGWTAHGLSTGRLVAPAAPPDVEALIKSFRKGKKLRRGRRSGGLLIDPELVHSVVSRLVAESGLQPAGMTGPVKRAGQNFEMLTSEKASWFSKSYRQIIPLAHIWMCTEVSREGLERIAQETGYQFFCSQENSRGQGVGALIHKRFKVVRWYTIDEVANVRGVADLRPVLVVLLEDTSPDCPPEQKTIWCAVHHAKSMRGGVERSGAICYRQNEIIVEHLGHMGPGAIGGDFNVLPGTPVGDKVISVLTDGGFVFVDADDRRPTHSMGGRLDLLFTLAMEKELHIEALLAWFASPEIGRGLTDHAAQVYS